MNLPPNWKHVRREYEGLPPAPRQHYTTGGKPKTRFATRERAEQVIDKMMAAGPTFRPGCTYLNAYQCRICQRWHIGQT